MKYNITPGEYPKNDSKNSDEFIGNGYSISKRGEAIVLSHINGSLQGEYKEVVISLEDSISLKSGIMDLDHVLVKYSKY